MTDHDPDRTDDETRVRELLRAAVPEAPEVSPPGRPARSRGPVVAVLAAAAAVAAIVVVPLALEGDDDRGADRATTSTEPTVERTPLPVDPYAVDPCPDRLPTEAAAPRAVPDLRTARSVRLCGVDAPRSEATGAEWLGPDDALVSDLSRLADAVAELPDADQDVCAAASYYDPYRTSIVVTTPRGTTTLTASSCAALDVAGRAVAAGDVADLVVEALGRQRATAEYPHTYAATTGRDMSAWCDAPTTLAPVLPSDSDLAGALLCPDYNVARATPQRLESAALERLRSAWARTDPPAVDDGFDGYDDEQAHVVALTSYGDLVQMVPKEGVDGLVLVAPRQAFFAWQVATVPTTLDELTSD